jgi:hypothetical protein
MGTVELIGYNVPTTKLPRNCLLNLLKKWVGGKEVKAWKVNCFVVIQLCRNLNRAFNLIGSDFFIHNSIGWPHEARVNHTSNIGSCYLANHSVSFTKVSRLMSRQKSMFVLTTKGKCKQINKLGEISFALFNVKVNYAQSWKS